MKQVVLLIILGCIFHINKASSQILFAEECFVGGVTVAGRTAFVNIDGYTVIKWEENYKLKAAYALTYRYNRPQPKPLFINESEYLWDYATQIGEEQNEQEEGQNVDFFAVHGIDITDDVVIDKDSVYIYMPGNDGISGQPNQGWWSIDLVVLYTAPHITDTTCVRVYTASQPQITPQDYLFSKPNYKPDTDVAFSIYSDRLNSIPSDRSIIGINHIELGEIGGADAINPGFGGVRGHFYYENSKLYGLDDDTANTRVFMSDGIAIINDYLNEEPMQKLGLHRIKHNMIPNFSNPHPAFFITYTPSCQVIQENINRGYEYCLIQSPTGQDIIPPTPLQALPGYDHYAWTPAIGLSDTTLANPICTADSSRWYRVSMWNDDGEVCSQTIPVFVTVNPVPRPTEIAIKPSVCPKQNGQIVVKNPAGKEPFTYFLNHVPQDNGVFEALSPGSYDISVQSAAGCVWDTTVVVPMETVQHAAFTANPEMGYSPLRVVFNNLSEHADAYTWLINGAPHSENKFMAYTFEEAGEYEVSLVAHGHEGACADTATVTIYVYQGLELILPNIITPNGDGMNDALVAQTAGIAHLRWEVYNRWGKVLHTGEANHPPAMLTLWSPEQGQYNSGTYTVILTAQGDSGEVKQFVQQVVVVGD